MDILEDVGASLSPLIDRGQIEGGFIQGVGWLTLEELLWDAEGRLATAGASTYKLPSWSEMPEVFNVNFLERAAEPGVIFGSKAVGRQDARRVPADCGQRSTQACAFSAGSPAATRAKWDALLARLRQAPISLGGAAFSYAEVVTLVSFGLSFVQPFSTPVPDNSAPAGPGIAQGLQQLWTARSSTPSARPGPPPAAAAAAAQRYGGAEQGYAVQCDEAPSPPASAYPGLQRLLLRRSGVTGLPDLWGFDEPCATWPVRGRHLQRPVEHPHQPHPGDRQHHRPVPAAPRRHRHDPPARQRAAPGRPRLRPHHVSTRAPAPAAT